MKVRELEAQYNIVLPEDTAYQTVGGFVLNRLGFIPRGGESFEDEATVSRWWRWISAACRA